MSTARIITGDVLDVLPTLDAGSVQCVVTSPPYFGLRSYLPTGDPNKAKEIGTEKTPQEYVEKMVTIFRDARRVLRDDGTLWLNLGDSYSGSWGAQSREHAGKHASNISAISANQARAAQRRETRTGSADRTPGLAPKNLIGVPWRVAFALQDDGWTLRSDIIWAKPNPMPESVLDRPTRSHEYLFLFSKSRRYFYDAPAIAEPAILDGRPPRNERATETQKRMPTDKVNGIRPRGKNEDSPDRKRAGFNGRWDAAEASGSAPITRNKRSVWTISPAAFPEAHFAVMPCELARPCILAGSAGGGLVLDPFAGSGTVGVEALKHGRDFLGIELNAEYAAMARSRILNDAPLLNRAEAG